MTIGQSCQGFALDYAGQALNTPVMRHTLPAILVLILCSSTASADSLPRPLAVNYQLLSQLKHTDTKSAQAAWRGKHGQGRVSVVKVDKKSVLKLKCGFSGKTVDRVSWDRKVNLDLTGCRGIRFRAFCRDSSAIKGMTAYFRSGDGWYSIPFNLTEDGEWNSITLDKAQTRIEGRPWGWSKIDTIRISAWRSKRDDVNVFLTDLGAVGTSASIALIRAESINDTKSSELGPVLSYTKALAERFNTLDISCSVISDRDVTAKLLARFRVVILPYNPDMKEGTAASLATYLKGGGKMISFYTLPSQLEPIVQISNGKHMKQKRAGHFASMRRTGKVPEGLPLSIGQVSWNIFQARPVAGRSSVAATWFDAAGKSTGEPAIIVSDNCIHVTHVLLTDDPANKQTMLLAMAGHFLADAWQTSAERRIKRIERFGPYERTGMALRDMKADASDEPELVRMLDHADRLADQSIEEFQDERYAAAFETAGESRRLLIECYCSMERPDRNEFRGVWCHNAMGVAGMDWDSAVKVLADNGFTAVFPNSLWATTAFYESDVLDVSPQVAIEGDQLVKCLAACKKYGIECHVWRVCWNMGGKATAETLKKMKKQNRLQEDYDGKLLDQWLCPSDQRNRKLEVDAMLELVTKYKVDGIHFDYIRYPNSAACYCSRCKSQFEKRLGKKMRNWPADAGKSGKYREEWLNFRRDNITAVVSAVSITAKRKKPDVKVSAAVFSNWSVHRDNIGQDWKLWCEKGYLDFICPMNYTQDTDTFDAMTRTQQELVPNTPCYPGIGFSSWQYSEDNITELIDQIKTSRRLQTGGFMIFNYGAAEARDVIPLCGTGLTRASDN